jgi:hypothetical protein
MPKGPGFPVCHGCVSRAQDRVAIHDLFSGTADTAVAHDPDNGATGPVFCVLFPVGKIGLDAKTQMPYSRPLMNASAAADTWRTKAFLRKQTNDPRGWARTWESCDDNTPAGREAFGRLQGRKRHASDTQARSPRGRRWLRGQCAWRRVKRPIAPGKVSCPLPPWDTTFPGAFFARLHALPAEKPRTNAESRGRKWIQSTAIIRVYPRFPLVVFRPVSRCLCSPAPPRARHGRPGNHGNRPRFKPASETRLTATM